MRFVGSCGAAASPAVDHIGYAIALPLGCMRGEPRSKRWPTFWAFVGAGIFRIELNGLIVVGHCSAQIAFLSFDIKKVSERVPARFAFLCAPAGL